MSDPQRSGEYGRPARGIRFPLWARVLVTVAGIGLLIGVVVTVVGQMQKAPPPSVSSAGG